MSYITTTTGDLVRKIAPVLFSVILVALLTSSFVPPQLLPVPSFDLEMADMEDDTETNNKENEREFKKEDKIMHPQALAERNGLINNSLATLNMFMNWTNHILDISTPPPEQQV